MGGVFVGIHEPIARMLTQKHGLIIFVETGTHFGNTALWAANSGMYNVVMTIEADDHLWSEYHERLEAKDINAWHGKSEDILPGIVGALEVPALFWLDAHYSGPGTYEGENPLFKEIEIINKSRVNHVIMVDDARIFDADTVLRITEALGDNRRMVWIKDDVIVAEPMPKPHEYPEQVKFWAEFFREKLVAITQNMSWEVESKLELLDFEFYATAKFELPVKSPNIYYRYKTGSMNVSLFNRDYDDIATQINMEAHALVATVARAIMRDHLYSDEYGREFQELLKAKKPGIPIAMAGGASGEDKEERKEEGKMGEAELPPS